MCVILNLVISIGHCVLSEYFSSMFVLLGPDHKIKRLTCLGKKGGGVILASIRRGAKNIIVLSCNSIIVMAILSPRIHPL